jgi:uncharacterized SAM-binding protein YcdF (DUF218 family)
MLILTKLLSIFVYPLGAAILVAAMAFALSFTSWRRIGRVLLGVALVALWIAATPIFADWLNLRLESQFPPVSIEMLPQSDAVVLLGGASENRVEQALRIYRASKAPLIVISGGSLPWMAIDVPEAQRIANRLVELGAPRSALVLETGSRTTRENAINTAAIFKEHGWRNGVLVTSSYHMPRALAAFQKVGLDVVPAAIGTEAWPVQIDSVLDLVPDADDLAWTTYAIKEMIGLCIYRLRGWA